MTSIKLYVTGAEIHAEVSGLLTAGMVGLPVEIVWDDEWKKLNKTLLCKTGSLVRTVLNVEDTAFVAHEVMVSGQKLELGIEGRNADGTLVLPTIWADCGFVVNGANADADPSTEPTLPVWAQLRALVGDPTGLNTQVKDNLVAAVNEVLALCDEDDTEQIQKIVEEYLEAHLPADGISVTHSWDGTVLTVTSASGTSAADLRGSQGEAGYTPVKGTDYCTESDKQELVEAVLAALPAAEGVSF